MFYNKVVDIISHQYQSYYFKDYLHEILPFPEEIIDEIIKKLNLAVDLNIKNENLKLLVIKDLIKNKERINYLKKKYRRTVHTAKKYQLINYLHYYLLI